MILQNSNSILQDRKIASLSPRNTKFEDHVERIPPTGSLFGQENTQNLCINERVDDKQGVSARHFGCLGCFPLQYLSCCAIRGAIGRNKTEFF